MKKGLAASLVLALLTSFSGCSDCRDSMCGCDACGSSNNHRHDWDVSGYWEACGCDTGGSPDYDVWYANHCWNDSRWGDVECDGDWYSYQSACSGVCNSRIINNHCHDYSDSASWDACACGSGGHPDYDVWYANHCWYDSWWKSVECDGDWYSYQSDCSDVCSSYIDDNQNVDDHHNVDDNHDANDHSDYARACTRNASCYEDEICKDHFCVLKSSVDDNSDIEYIPECHVNSDCKDDMLCTEGRCIPCQANACDTSKEVECVFSSQCESGLCVDGVCLLPGKCAIDANCSDGQICFDGSCIVRPECLSDSECGEGRICNASNECEDDVECRADADCGIGLICVSNMCAQCRLNCECPNDGDICMNGACVSGN